MEIEKRRAFIINFIYFLIIAGISFILLKYGIGLLTPFVLGFLFAYILKRPIRALGKVMKGRNKLAALIVVAVFYITIGALIFLLGAKIVSGFQAFFQSIPVLYADYVAPLLTGAFYEIERLVTRMDTSMLVWLTQLETQLIQSLGKMASSLSIGTVTAVSDFAVFLPSFFIKNVLMIISTFFIAMDYDKLTGFCLNQLSGRGQDIFLQVKEYVIGTLFVCIRSYILIMSITCIELCVGFTIIGLEHAFIIAAMIAVFDILPVLGTGGIMIPWVVLAALSGRYSLALGLLCVYIFVTVMRNILEPKIVGGQLGLHPVVTLSSMFAGVQLFGGVGLFGFPIGLSLLCYLNNNGTISIFKTAENKK